MRLIILSILFLVALTARQRFSDLYHSVDSPQQKFNYAQKQYWFDQILDHTNYQTVTYWKQRYWVIDQYFNPNVGAVFLFICGQYVCQGVPQARQWVVSMASRLQSLILVLQHRYYGSSLPFGNSSFSMKNFVYLNSEQALSDLAYFLTEVKAKSMYKVKENPWIPIGGSYPGALSAWFRYKYPHLSVGAIASSAVIVAIEDFPQFDQQIYLSSFKSGNWCVQALNSSNARVQQILQTEEGTQFKAGYQGGQKLTNQEFLFFWIDSIVGMIQYGKRTDLCNNLKGKSADEQFNYLKQVIAKQNSVFQYGSYYLSNETFAVQNGQGARSWYYQSCTQFGFWQTFSTIHPMRSFKLDLNFYRQFCQRSFGLGVWPKIQRKNMEYGGLNEKSFNLLMSNGDQDPWKWASLQTSQDRIISRVAVCDNCAHCVDLYTPTSNDAESLKKMRNEQFLTVMEWISSHWEKTNGKNKLRSS